MNLAAVGRLVAERRRSLRMTLREAATGARVGRSTLAAFEAGTLTELGYGRWAASATRWASFWRRVPSPSRNRFCGTGTSRIPRLGT
jgi:transcriptional regulator with XRE-family HTH domain